MTEPNHPSSKGFFTRLREALFGSEAPGSPPSASQRYRKAVKIAWVDEKLSEAELSWLAELGVSREVAAGVEQGVMADVKEEVAARLRAEEELASRADVMARYRVAVAVAWADEELSQAESHHLSTLESELGLGREQACDIEREIIGVLKEAAITPQTDGLDPYRVAVEMAWVDKKLDEAEEKHLRGLEADLEIGRVQAEQIEREVMGGSREELMTPNLDDEDEEERLNDERWVDLAEECVEVVDELDRNMARFDDPKRQELADHVIWRLAEVLERSGIDLIFDDTTFDNKRHKPEKATSLTASGTTILETLSPGFAVGRRVLRRARVRVE